MVNISDQGFKLSLYINIQIQVFWLYFKAKD
jgi:hypothetical protein